MTVKELLSLVETETNESLKAVAINVEDGEIATYTRSDIDLEEYYGWEDCEIKFWGIRENRIIMYLAMRESGKG